MKNNNLDYADFFYHPIFVKKKNSKTTTEITYSNSFTILKYFQLEVVSNNTNIIDLRLKKVILKIIYRVEKEKNLKRIFIIN